MKKQITNLIFLLLIFSANAQKPKSKINQTIDNINAILQENKLAYYTDKNQNGAFIRKISATQKGIITFTDSIPKVEKKENELQSDCCPSRAIRSINLFKIYNWEIMFPIVYLKDKNNQVYGKIIGLQEKDLYNLKQLFFKLKTLSKKDVLESRVLDLEIGLFPEKNKK